MYEALVEGCCLVVVYVPFKNSFPQQDQNALCLLNFSVSFFSFRFFVRYACGNGKIDGSSIFMGGVQQTVQVSRKVKGGREMTRVAADEQKYHRVAFILAGVALVMGRSKIGWAIGGGG